jgi:hypothetical protein
MAQDRQVKGDSGDDEAEPGREPRDANEAIEEAEQGGHEANANQVREEPVRASRHEDPAQVAERHEERGGPRE